MNKDKIVSLCDRSRARFEAVTSPLTGAEKARARKTIDANKMIIDRIKGLPAQPGTPESEADPTNPNVR